MNVKIYIIFITIFLNQVFANEACSRVAIINQQEVLVDPNLNQKGEGLRFHLNKDPIASELLEKYQVAGNNKLRPAIIGSVGTLLLLGSVVSNSSDNNRKALVISGLSTIFVNFLITKTIDNNNEKYLVESVYEYNKRQKPKIYIKSKDGAVVDPALYLEKTWGF